MSPISKENLSRYPEDWKDISRAIRRRRARMSPCDSTIQHVPDGRMVGTTAYESPPCFVEVAGRAYPLNPHYRRGGDDPMLEGIPQNDQPNRPKSSLVTTITLEFDGMTWGDLRRFVALADQWNVRDEQDVVLDYVPDIDDFEPTGLLFHARGGA